MTAVCAHGVCLGEVVNEKSIHYNVMGTLTHGCQLVEQEVHLGAGLH
jgi:hypothetical protein